MTSRPMDRDRWLTALPLAAKPAVDCACLGFASAQLFIQAADRGWLAIGSLSRRPRQVLLS